jgi:Mrp family chromosome partitioning ATPase
MVLALRQPPGYLASVSLLATQRDAAQAQLGFPQPRPVDGNAYRAAVARGPVAGDALTAVLGRPPTDRELRRFRAGTRVRVRPTTTSSVIRIEHVAFDAGVASQAALALADALTRWERARSATGLRQGVVALKADLARIDAALQRASDGSGGTTGTAGTTEAERSQLLALRDRRARELDVASARSNAYAGVGLVSSFAPGQVDVRPLARWIVAKGLLAAFVALVTVYGVLYLRARLDPRAGAPAALAALAGLSVVAELPPLGLGTVAAGRDAIEALRMSVLRAAAGQASFVVGVTSPKGAAAKEGVSVALAASLVRAGRRTLLVDADLRNPTIARRLGVTAGSAAPFEWHLRNPRLDVTPGMVTLDEARTCDFVPGLDPVSDPQELLERNLEVRLASWRQRYDVVVLDGPPVLPHGDMLTIAPVCDTVALCADPAVSTREDLVEAGELLRRAATAMHGLVVTNVARA